MAVNGLWRLYAHDPVDEIERMLAQIRRLAAGVIPEPAEVVDRAVWIVRALRCWTEEEIVVEVRWRSSIRGIAKAGRDVARVVIGGGDEGPDPAGLDELARMLKRGA